MVESRAAHPVTAEAPVPAGRFIAATAKPPLDPELERELCSLLFEARHLADSQFCSQPHRNGAPASFFCIHCLRFQKDESRLDHTYTCPVGRLLRRLQAITDLIPSSNPTTERSSSGEATAHAAAEGQPLRESPSKLRMFFPERLWRTIRDEFSVGDKRLLSDAIVGEAICQRGYTIDVERLPDELLARLRAAKGGAQ
jgi:hypothetical protein